MMKTKNLSKPQKLSYGLFYRNEKYVVDKYTKTTEPQPYLKFRSFTQGLKAISYINSHTKLSDFNAFKDLVNLKDRTEIWKGKGRNLGEKSFLIFEKGKLKAYGFYELYHQIESKAKIDKLKIPIHSISPTLQNELQLSLLRGEFETAALPK